MNKLNLPVQYCNIPWSSIEINNLGYYRVCCISNSYKDNYGLLKDENNEWMHVSTHDISEVLNSPKHREIRETMLAGGHHSNCITCTLRDNATTDVKKMSKGRRIFHALELNKLTNWALPTWDEVNSNKKDDWKNGIISLDIKLGNLCNMACAHCDPINSSQWVDLHHEFTGDMFVKRSDTYPIANFTKKTNGKLEIVGANWYDTDKWQETFKKIAPQLRHIYVVGGEPMIIKWHNVMLDYLINNDYAKNIVLEYDTNFSAINPHIALKIKKFKNVHMRVSIDGIGEVYNWIRFPGKWDLIEKNILENRSMVKDLTGCLMPYNAWNIIDCEKWSAINGLHTSWRFIVTPSHLNLRFFPLALKNELIELYKSANTPETNKAAIYLEQSIGEENNEHVISFIKWADHLTKHRGKDWRELTPRLAYHLRNY